MVDTSSALRPVAVVVVGTGWWATQFHLPALLSNPDAVVVAIVDPDADRRARAATHFGIQRTHPDLTSALAAGGIDGVVLATPSSTHHALAVQAITAGVATLIEKPMTLSGPEAWHLVELARIHDVAVTVGYTYQFTSTAQRLAEVVGNGGVGEILMTSSLFATMADAYYRGEPERYADAFGFPVVGPQPSTYSSLERGGGQAYAQLTHPAALVMHATGLSATHVQATMHHAGLAVDVADALAVRWDNGAVGTFASIGNLRPDEPHQEHVHLYGTEGFAEFDLVSASGAIHYADGRREELRPAASELAYPAGAVSAHLVELIRGRVTNRAPGDLGARTVDLIEAAHRSARSGEREQVAVAARVDR